MWDVYRDWEVAAVFCPPLLSELESSRPYEGLKGVYLHASVANCGRGHFSEEVCSSGKKIV